MASWASRRKALYAGFSFALIAVIVGLGAWVVVSREPSCSDGVQNGGERGVDCGGACARLCKNQVREPSVLWTRAFETSPGIYSAAAYVEHANVGAYAPDAKYIFKLFDARNVLVAERAGTIDISPERTTPVIESNINTGNRVPVRAFFEFTSDVVWERTPARPRVRITDESFDGRGRLEAVVVNDSLDAIEGITLAAVLFDEQGVAQQASKSRINFLPAKSSERVVFTWPLIPVPIARSEVTPLLER